ncbi:metal ABC transporter substrate-binding protein [Breznakiella homolactica]|uniref:ABC transporter substrate-binding protein n=1 Tax=Breznakiella homolactica TaxID=2798577 RepID=A0A7T8BBD3_9SPIR|nr:metal ABC transporter substrate-binding protein [Breznakiella homolactica]QQO10442.1 metal ABC transporter substrate-binding protein [Breznakiella homolactica]
MKKSAIALTGIVLSLWAGVFQLEAQDSPRVVASTSWTAAIARAGGARNIITIAPPELKHPPEYDIKPSDLENARSADLLVYSGYEKFAQRLGETVGNARILEVYTDNLPSVLKQEAKKVAVVLGTETEYAAWEASFDRMTAEMKDRLSAAYPDKRAVVHRFLATQAEWLGFEVVGTFGPGESSPQALLNLVRLKPAVIIDNWHNVSGKALAESLPASYVELINFPGKDGTRTIEDVFAYNQRQFLEAAR